MKIHALSLTLMPSAGMAASGEALSRGPAKAASKKGGD